MRKLLVLLFLPLGIFAQERQQKEAIRQGLPARPVPSAPGMPQTPSFRTQPPREVPSEYDRKRSLRDGTGYYTPTPPRPRQHYYYYDPYWDWGWGWNRWNRWGAPYFYNDWYPHFYYDTWGYRQPARVYIQEDGRRDTVKGVKPRISLGIQTSTLETGAFLTVGRQTYFLAEYQHTFRRDKSTFYSELTRDVVVPWEDKRLNDIRKGGSLFLGLGQRFGRAGVHGALGLVKERVRYQYFDELFVLSNNGYYSFPSYVDTYLALKVGGLYDFKLATIKADYDFSRDLVSVGVGVNF